MEEVEGGLEESETLPAEMVVEPIPFALRLFVQEESPWGLLLGWGREIELKPWPADGPEANALLVTACACCLVGVGSWPEEGTSNSKRKRGRSSPPPPLAVGENKAGMGGIWKGDWLVSPFFS